MNNDYIFENLNYARDARTQGPADEHPTVIIGDAEVELPTCWEVCPVCSGAGKHVNPSIDAGGISAQRMHEDPDFAQSYFSGAYDVPCNHCGGRTTVRGVNWEALSPEMSDAYEDQLRMEYEAHQEHLAEIRAGA